MDNPHHGSADEFDALGRVPDPTLRPSRFGAGYTVGQPAQEYPTVSQPPLAAPEYAAPTDGSAWGSPTPSGPPAFDTAHPLGPYYGVPSPLPTAGRKYDGALVVGVMAAALVLALGSFLAGRYTAPKTPDHTAIDTTGPTSVGGSTTPKAPDSSGITVTDPGSDSVPHAVDGQVHGPSEIVSQSIRSDDGLLVITMEFSPATPMNLISTGFRIRLDPDTVPTCKDSVLDSWDWSVDYDTGGIEISKHTADCENQFQMTSLTGSSDITGSTLEIKVSEDSLGISPDQRITIRSCVSTRIDSSHTTFIQDWAPDSPSGTTGEI